MDDISTCAVGRAAAVLVGVLASVRAMAAATQPAPVFILFLSASAREAAMTHVLWFLRARASTAGVKRAEEEKEEEEVCAARGADGAKAISIL